MLPEWTATHSKGIPVHVESTREFFTPPKDGTQVTMRAGDRSLKVVCMLKP